MKELASPEVEREAVTESAFITVTGKTSGVTDSVDITCCWLVRKQLRANKVISHTLLKFIFSVKLFYPANAIKIKKKSFHNDQNNTHDEQTVNLLSKSKK